MLTINSDYSVVNLSVRNLLRMSSYEFRMYSESESESESELLYDWQITANQFVLTTSPLRLSTSNFFPQLNSCGHTPNVTSSLTRGQVCRLQMLLVITSAVILRAQSRGTHDYILLSHLRAVPFRRLL
jgi:hypothetical protein